MAWLLGGRAGGLLVTYASWRWAAAVLLAAFAVIEARSQHALLPTRLLRNRNRLGADGSPIAVTDMCAGALGPRRRTRPGIADAGQGRISSVMSLVKTGELAAGPSPRLAAYAGRRPLCSS
jgi:hypothetical protein